MWTRKKILVWFCILYHLAAGGQVTSTTSIAGKVSAANGKPLSPATISLYRLPDSTLTATKISDNEGLFEIQVQPGDYFLNITFLSYKQKNIPSIRLSNTPVNLGTLVLYKETQALNEIVVTARKPQMKLELDKKVFNVAQDLSNAGLNASDVLNNIPSVTVDVDGTVALRGNENVQILIDGKPSALTGSRSQDALRNLQGNMIESIEVITNPSSRYEAAGEAGIINIILKKKKVRGLNGTFTGTAGYPTALGGSAQVNYRTRHFNFFVNYGIDYRSTPGRGHSEQSYSGADTSFVYTQDQRIDREELAHTVMGGLEFFPDEKNSFTGSFLYNPSTGINRSQITYLDYDKTGELKNMTLRKETEHEDEAGLEGSLNYRHTFSKKEHVLTADIKYTQGKDFEKTDYLQQDYAGNPYLIQYSDNDALEKNYLFQTDYIHPFTTNSKMELGVRSNTRIVENRYALQQQDEQGNWEVLPVFRNNMIYTEKIHAAYVMGSHKFSRLGIQGGLRAEYSDITTELTDSKEVNHRTYLNIFPSANLSYKLNDHNTFQLSYSYRINRPRFRNLLPYSNFSDLRSFFKGNPDLDPELTHSFETGHLWEWGNGSLLSNIYYRYTTNEIERITEIDSAGVAYIYPVNLSTENAYGLEFNFNYSFNSWWRATASMNLYRAITRGNYNDQNLYSDTYSGSSRATSRMRFFGFMDFQVSFNYWAPRVTTQGKRLGNYFIDLGFSADVLKGKGTITLNVRDLFNSRMRRFVTDYDGYYSNSEFQWRARQTLLTFTYRLHRLTGENREKDENEGVGESDLQ